MNAEPLRDMKRNTELLILTELIEKPSMKMKEMAHKLGVTVQAISQYLASMKKTGLLRNGGDSLRPTRKGMQALQEHFTAIKGRVDTILRRISVIDSCVALAEGRVAKGTRVGLLMRNGVLVALPGRKASSTGTALESSDDGEDVLVGELEGIVDLKLGRLTLLEVPSEREGGSKSADAAKATKIIGGAGKGMIVAGDIVSIALARRCNVRYPVIHAPLEYAMSALCKGVDVMFCGTKENAGLVLAAVRDLKKETGYEIKWELHRV
jgi:putative transcriptional regulator